MLLCSSNLAQWTRGIESKEMLAVWMCDRRTWQARIDRAKAHTEALIDLWAQQKQYQPLGRLRGRSGDCGRLTAVRRGEESSGQVISDSFLPGAVVSTAQSTMSAGKAAQAGPVTRTRRRQTQSSRAVPPQFSDCRSYIRGFHFFCMCCIHLNVLICCDCVIHLNYKHNIIR